MPSLRRLVTGVVIIALLAGCTVSKARPIPTAMPTAAGELDLAAGRSDPVADPLYPDYGNPRLDVLAYQLDLSWTPEKRQLSGTATVTIRAVQPLRDLTLDFLAAYSVDGVIVDGVAVTPGRRGNDLIVPTPHPLAADARTTLVVRYHGVPHAVPAPTNRSDTVEGIGLRSTVEGFAWTMQEPYGAFTWYPVSDHPSDEALYDVSVTVPKGWSAVAHGTPFGTTEVPGGTIFRWQSTDPVASYLATLAIGTYEKLTATGPRGLPITYWVRDNGRDDAIIPILRRTPEMLAWLEERFGPYPFPSAGAVMVESHSAMETQQMITMGGGSGLRALNPEQAGAITEVLLHELAHQWFGDSVTPRDWRGVWLNEGFAMYIQALWAIEQGRGNESSWIAWARERDRASRAEAGPPGSYKRDHFAENNVYVGPLLMLHEIHEEIGDEAFFALSKDWVQTQRNKPVDRDLFVTYVNRHTGRDLTAVIDKWLDSPTTPTA